MIERITAWECIGCGRVENAKPCVGICADRRTEFVYAADHDAAIARLAEVVRQIANTTPRRGECERTWKALQARSRSALRTLGEGTAERGPPAPAQPS
jgi:hypothetical protein